MFYKEINNEWHTANEVHFPDKEKLSKKNRRNRDGWEWHDKPPKIYLEWMAGLEVE